MIQDFGFVLVALVMALGVTVSGCGRPAPQSTPSGDSAPSAWTKLKGKWVRPDGGYVLEIKSVRADGTIDAGYFNPNPIHVAGGRANVENGKVRVMVVLRDEGYPNCTYTLTYDEPTDRLVGVYYQAALQERYDIVFARLP